MGEESELGTEEGVEGGDGGGHPLAPTPTSAAVEDEVAGAPPLPLPHTNSECSNLSSWPSGLHRLKLEFEECRGPPLDRAQEMAGTKRA